MLQLDQTQVFQDLKPGVLCGSREQDTGGTEQSPADPHGPSLRWNACPMNRAGTHMSPDKAAKKQEGTLAGAPQEHLVPWYESSHADRENLPELETGNQPFPPHPTFHTTSSWSSPLPARIQHWQTCLEQKDPDTTIAGQPQSSGNPAALQP